jgi:hypothetical protein
MPAMQTYQNEHNMLLNFPRCKNTPILLLQISKTDSNALDIAAIIITSNLEKYNLIPQTDLLPN